MNINSKTALKIKEIRMSKNISQQALAKSLAISNSAYSRMENGEIQITLNMIEKLANEFSISLTDILSLPTTEIKNFTNSNLLAQKDTISISVSAEDLEKILGVKDKTKLHK